MDQLIRETQPPAGTLRSPVPQYWNPDTEKYERVLGIHGAPRAMLYGPNGQPISTSNRLPVDVGAQVATESTLAEAVSRLNAILTRLEGTLDVDVGGQIHADVDLGDVTVQIGEVQQGKRGQNAEPWQVTLSGRKPSITQIADAVTVTAGAEVIFRTRSGLPDVDAVTMVVTTAERVPHAFTARILFRITSGATDASAWIDVQASSGGGPKAVISRYQVPASQVIEYRVRNNDTVDRTYNAWVQEWVR